MNDHFAEMVATLEEASHGVQRDLDRLALARPRDIPALTKLSEAVRDFANQADALFLMMVERDAPLPLIGRAEDLVEFFQAALTQIGAVLQPERG